MVDFHVACYRLANHADVSRVQGGDQGFVWPLYGVPSTSVLDPAARHSQVHKHTEDKSTIQHSVQRHFERLHVRENRRKIAHIHTQKPAEEFSGTHFKEEMRSSVSVESFFLKRSKKEIKKEETFIAAVHPFFFPAVS